MPALLAGLGCSQASPISPSWPRGAFAFKGGLVAGGGHGCPVSGCYEGVSRLTPHPRASPAPFSCSVVQLKEGMFQRSCGLCRLYQSFFSSFCGGWGEACGFCVCGFALLYFVLFSNLLQQRRKWFKLQNSLGGNVRPRGETPAWSNSLFTPYFTITSFTYHIIDKQVFAQPDCTYCDPCSCYWRALLVLNLNSTFNISAGRIPLPI